MSNRVLKELRDMGKKQVLSFATTRHHTRLQAERELLAAAYQWAVLHNPDALAPFNKSAHARATPAGAAGTPLVTEYAAAAFGARIQTSPFGAKKLIADAVDLHHRLPRLNSGIAAGNVRVGHARHVAAATRDLTAEEAAWVDQEVHECADGRLGWLRFKTLVAGKVAAAAPETAAAKERAAAMEHGVWLSPVNEHGLATLTVQGEATTILALHHTVTVGAKTLKESMPGATLGQRRVTALVTAAGAKAPRVKLHLHLTADSPIVRMEGHGPLTVEYVRHLLARVTDLAGPVRVQPVIDLNQTIAVDAYEIPAKLRDAVHLIHPGDVFPYATNTSRAMDLDHAIPYAAGGATSSENLQPLTRTHHRIKTHHTEPGHQGRGWEVRHPFPGITIWRDPHGAHYLVDPTGTRTITPTRADETPTRAEIHATELLLDWAG